MDSYSDEITRVISLCKIQKDKKYKEKIVKEIIADICAMLNSNGGRVVISVEDSSPQTSRVIRVLEQFIISANGLIQTVSKINFSEGDAGSIIVSVGKADSLITTNYNLYLPSQTQVVAVPSLQPLGEIKDNIINRKVVLEPVQRGTHCKKFMKHKIYTSVHESKTCQLKNLKADPSKRTTLADRMTGKGNKFSCYVSAFANHRGGHIYYGIRDDGVVEGEFIPNEKDKGEIIKKVEKAINKMIWPEQIGKPKRGEHWEIFFQPVVDENSKPVPSTFVIVIYIAPCLGGVFTEEPQCYEMVEEKATKMSFVTWKKRISPPVLLRKSQRKRKIPNSDERRKWSSDVVRKAFTTDCDKLRKIVSNGNWEILEKECNALQNNSSCRETMQLFILFKQITACNRRGKFTEAFQFLEEYKALFPNVKDKFIFEMLGLYLEAALKRASGDLEALKERLTKALAMADEIEPGLVTATVYIFAATVSDLINLESPVVLTARALEHLECVQDFSDVLAAMRRRANIILAEAHLGCNVKGELLKDSIDLLGLEKAKSCIKAISESACEEHPLSVYFDIQLNLVLSKFKFRHSQLYPDQKNRDLDDAWSYAKKAQSLAEKYEFVEMTEWSKNNETLCLQELDRAETHTHNHGDEDRPHRNSTPRDVTQNAESQDTSAKSQNSDDLNVKENLQAKAVNREALPGPPMVPTPTTLQELKAENSGDKQVQPQSDRVSPPGHQKQPNTRAPHRIGVSKFRAKPFQPRTSSANVSVLTTRQGIPMNDARGASAFERNVSFSGQTGTPTFVGQVLYQSSPAMGSFPVRIPVQHSPPPIHFGEYSYRCPVPRYLVDTSLPCQPWVHMNNAAPMMRQPVPCRIPQPIPTSPAFSRFPLHPQPQHQQQVCEIQSYDPGFYNRTNKHQRRNTQWRQKQSRRYPY